MATLILNKKKSIDSDDSDALFIAFKPGDKEAVKKNTAIKKEVPDTGSSLTHITKIRVSSYKTTVKGRNGSSAKYFSFFKQIKTDSRPRQALNPF